MRCMEIEWKEGETFACKGPVASWDEVVARPGLAAVRRIADLRLGPFAAVYEVDMVSFAWGTEDDGMVERRSTFQYLVEESSQVPVAQRFPGTANRCG